MFDQKLSQDAVWREAMLTESMDPDSADEKAIPSCQFL